MTVSTVASVDDHRVDMTGDEVRRARMWVANNQRVDAHGIERKHRVEKRFTFIDAAGGSRDVDNVGTEGFPGVFERHAGASAVFEEESVDRTAPQGI